MSADQDLTAAFKLEQQQYSDNNDGAHIVADAFVARVLKVYGFPLLAEAYQEGKKNWWYS